MQIMLANDIVIVKSFDGQAEEQICDLLIKRRKERKEQQANELAVIRHLNTHGRND
jgi:hypothetical protein